MLQISPGVVDAFSAQRRVVVLEELLSLVVQVAPGLARTIPREEMVRRIDAGISVANASQITSNRDLTLVCLAHALLGADIFSRPGLEWLADLLGEAPGDPDTRVFRMHIRFSEMTTLPSF